MKKLVLALIRLLLSVLSNIVLVLLQRLYPGGLQNIVADLTFMLLGWLFRLLCSSLSVV